MHMTLQSQCLIAARQTIAAIVFVTALINSTDPTWACACCSEHGERFESIGPVDEYSKEVLAGMQFASEASLYETTGGWDHDVMGINNPAKSNLYHLQVRRAEADWVFSVHDDGGNEGTLSVTATDRLRQFAVDTNPEQPNQGEYVSVKLYKEWEISGSVSGTGIFDAGHQSPVTARIIFHGLGNSCTDTSQFSNWTLDVFGPEAKYRFFGELK